MGDYYLDDIDPNDLTKERCEELAELYHRDPYAFYNMWRDPMKIQRLLEGDDFKTTPVDALTKQIDALNIAGAPYSVIAFWRETLEHHNRGNGIFDDLLPAKTRPITKKIEQIESLCDYITGQLNYTVDNVTPAEIDFSDDSPYAEKWAQITNLAKGDDPVTEHNNGWVMHYKDERLTEASQGDEIVEVHLINHASWDIDIQEWYKDYIHPYSVDIQQKEGEVLIKLHFIHVYE